MKRKFIFIISTLFFGLVLIELVFRFIDPLSHLDPTHRILYKKNASKVFRIQHSKLDAEVFVKTNNLGFRGEDYRENENKRLRIVALGGGATYSFYNGEGKTWLDLSEKRLAEKFPEIWINNAGENFQPLQKSFLLFKGILEKFKPEYVVLLVGQDDLGKGEDERIETNETKTKAWYEWSEILYFTHYLFSSNEVSPYDLNWSLEKTEKLEMTGEDLSKSMMEHSRRFLPFYRRRLEAFVRYCLENKITPVLLTQASLFGEGIDSSTGRELRNIKYKNGNSLQYSLILEMYNDVTRVVAHRFRIPLIDLAAQLPKNSAYYYDPIYYTNQGAEKVSEIVAASLGEILQHKSKEEH